MVLPRYFEVFSSHWLYDYLLKVTVVDVILHVPHLCCLWELCLLRRSHVGRPDAPSQEREMGVSKFW